MSINYSEKRDFIRMKTDSLLKFKEAGSVAVYEGKCVNISAAGVLFETDHPVNPGTLVEINITPELAVVKPLDATIEVLRSSPTNNGNFAIAGQIKDMH